jgi:multisubunit Na+/H+ antiporter MnhF subunit
MLTSSLVLFGLAAVAGIVLFLAISKGKNTPKAVVALHGLLAVSGLTILLVHAFKNPDHRPMAVIVLFLIAALGGIIAFARDMKGKPGPLGLIVIHAVVAVIAFVVLFMFTIGK